MLLRSKRVCPRCQRLIRGPPCPYCGTSPNPYATPTYKRTRRVLIREWVRQHGYHGIITGTLVITPHSTLDLTVDHINRDPYDNRLDTLRVLCRGCNTALSNI